MNHHKRLFGLIGYPLSHSFSKKYFDAKFEREGLSDCQFELFEITEISKLKTEVMPQHPNLCGFSITIPYKKEVISFLDDRSGLPLDACNCVHIVDGKLIGYNTDVIGFEQSLLPQLLPTHSPALILGTGGAAEGVKFVLKKLGIPFSIASRSGSKGTVGYEELTPDLIRKHKLIVNTTPLGTYPKVNEYPPLPYEGIGAEHYLFDLVYNPEETMFLRLGKERGATIKNGADMLVIQAEANWKIWNGI
jgi:shikimate dehydrogenase